MTDLESVRPSDDRAGRRIGTRGDIPAGPDVLDAARTLDAPEEGIDATDPTPPPARSGAVTASVVDVRVALPMPTWTRILAAVVGLAAAVAGTVAVFRTDNGVGSAALLLVAVFLGITAVDGQFPRLRIGDNEVMSSLTRAYRETKGKAERATAKAADAEGNSEDVMDGLVDAQARIARLETLAGVPRTLGPSEAGQTAGDAVRASTGAGTSAGTGTGAAPPEGARGEPMPDVAFGVDLDGPPPTDPGTAGARTTVPDELLALGERYKALRWTMPRGSARTHAMTTLVDEMRRVVEAAGDVDVVPLLGSDDIGLRLVAAAALYERPVPEAVAALAAQALSDRKPFNEYWSLRALRRGVRGRCDLLTEEVRDRLERRGVAVSQDAGRAGIISAILRDCP